MKPSLPTKASEKMKVAHTLPVEAQALSSAWVPFVHRLAQALEKLLEDQYLIITKKGTNEFVQFAGQGFFGLRVETISNHFRSDQNQLTDVQIANLIEIGWSAPTNNPEESTPANDPDGSPNYFIEFPTPLYVIEIAQMAVKTLTDVLHIGHPAFLEYEAFCTDGDSIALPNLGLKRSISSADNSDALPQLLLETVRELTGIDDWSFDKDGDIGGIRYGNVSTFVRLLSDRPYIRLHAVVLNNVQALETNKLLERINEMNGEEGFMHLIVRNNAVLALSDVPASPFVASIVAHGLGNFCQVADGFNTILQAEFGEDTLLTEPQPSQQLKH